MRVTPYFRNTLSAETIRELFLQRLRRKHSIERITMVERQISHADYMPERGTG